MKRSELVYSLIMFNISFTTPSPCRAESRCLYSKLHKVTWNGPYYQGFYGSPYRATTTDSNNWNVSLDIPQSLWHDSTPSAASQKLSASNVMLQNTLASQFIAEDISAPTAPLTWAKDSQSVTPSNGSSTKSIVSTLH